MKNVIGLFLKLVSIDSPSDHEQDMIIYVKNWLDKIGLEYKIDNKNNIFAKNRGIGRPLLFCVHLDTVEPGQGIKPVIKNGVIKSTGKTILGADNKAAVTALMSALEEYLEKEKNPKSFELLFTVGEETGNGLDNFNFNHIKSKYGFVFDSLQPIGSLILRSPFICSFKAEFKGKASHSSTPEKGINALLPAIKALSKIKVGKLDDGETTINIGLINCGTGINTVPEQVIIQGEIRSYSKELFENHLKKIKSVFSASEFTTFGFAPGYCHEKSSLLVKKVNKTYRALGINLKYYSYSAASDANVLNSKGIKIINLGDGVENAHTVQEQIKINDLIRLKKIILNLLSY